MKQFNFSTKQLFIHLAEIVAIMTGTASGAYEDEDKIYDDTVIIYEYEQEIKRNAKHIGEMEADVTNKKDQIYRMENNIRQLE